MTIRRLDLVRLALLVMLLLPFVSVLAQGDRFLEAGATVTGVLDTDNVAQVYAFAGNAGDVVSLTASSSTGLGLALLLSDSQGTAIAQDFGTSSPTSLTDVELPANDTYYVTVLSAMGVTLPAGSSFDLTFDSVPAETTVVATPAPTVIAVPETPAPEEILTTIGLQVNLTWDSLANMDLEVRDPVGGSAFFSTPQTASGGQFGVNVNSVCDNRTADSPTEQVVWPAGALPTGSYEVLVYYQPLDDCPTTDAANFTVTVKLDDQVLDSISGSTLPNEVFISSFIVNPDGTLTGRTSGLQTEPSVLPAPAADLVANAQPLEFDTPVTGELTNDDFFASYAFKGTADQLVTITEDATSGSLDTLLILLDSSGNFITANDDRAEGETNSSIVNYRLLADDTYVIVATRYGKDIGGTEGSYELNLTGPTGELPPEVLNLGLPNGDVEIALSWNTNADLQLLVRDPRGDSVFDDIPTVASGGRLAASGNVNCTPAQTSPVSYVYWPEGSLVAGLYEVEVWYQNDCGDTTPVNFSLNVRVAGVTVFSQSAQPLTNEVYLTSFIVGVDGTVRTGEGGFIGTRQQGGENRLDVSSLDFEANLSNAQPVVSDQPVRGSITADHKFDLYQFEGSAGDVVTISLVRTAGQLDAALFLLDPNGFQIADNDDAVVGESTDSLISEFTLPEDGLYTIIATHYGMQYGGTTGAYELTFSRLN